MNRRSLLAIIGGVPAGVILGAHYAMRDDPPRHPRPGPRPAPPPRHPRKPPVKVWQTSAACEGRKQCGACRGDGRFRDQLTVHFIMPDAWPKCPHGITADTLPEVSAADVPEWFLDRVAACAKCESTCWKSKCRQNNALRRPNFACPDNHFRPVLATETI